MARSQHSDSAGSQFFIMHGSSTHLDNNYAAFGKVTEGLDVVDKIAECKTDFRDKPKDPQVIKSIKIDDNGNTIGEPDTL
jgi:peptidyl-prolyl cis-trans isomerase B (cyclophilin B)